MRHSTNRVWPEALRARRCPDLFLRKLRLSRNHSRRTCDKHMTRNALSFPAVSMPIPRPHAEALFRGAGKLGGSRQRR